MGRRSGLIHIPSYRALPAVLAVALSSGVAFSQTPPPIAVRLPRCDVEPFPYEDFVQILRSQLAQDGGPDIAVSSSAPAGGPQLQVSGACGTRSAGVAIEVTAQEGSRVRRDVPFFDLPMDVRGRGLAMVAAELVRASMHKDASEGAASTVAPTVDAAPATSSPTSQTAPTPARSAASPPRARRHRTNKAEPKNAGNAGPPATVERPVERSSEKAPDSQPPTDVSRDAGVSPPRSGGAERNVYWGIAAQARATTPTTTVATGARAQVRVGGFVAGADWLASSADDALGTTRGNIVAGWVGLVVWESKTPRWWIGTSPRASFGIAIAAANPSAGGQGSVAREPYLDAAWQLDARWEFGEAGGLMLGADAGVARGMTAVSGEGPVLALGGWFAGARVGLEGAP